MFGFPGGTEYNKKIPKQKFYENINISPSLKKCFVEQINAIYWRNKIAPDTINLAKGENVTEIEVFEIQLEGRILDESVLRQIDKEVPYHIVYVLESEGKYQLWTAYKEAAQSGNNAFKVDTYYHTDWLTENEITLKIDGLNTDKVYENFVRQIAGERLQNAGEESIKESVEKDNRRKALEKQIDTLQKKIAKEKQFNIQVQINTELKKLKKELQELQ